MSTKVVDIKVPDMGDFDGVPVIEILVAEGDEVAVDDSLITLESEKATMEIPSPHAGKITEILVAIDETVQQGTVIARM
ncbi:MAG TPA: branched-chain alpha-keto acid dehydrogenase subunit E2, partial [Oceanospirillales bacterium]|nr:branched-chain alpha-keto acid dehydrogenase subunit E2 [Oceanospirillales bacterium]